MDQMEVDDLKIAFSIARGSMSRVPGLTFFTHLALKFRMVPSEEVKTIALRRFDLLVNPKWFLSIAAKERIGVLCHMSLHVALMHPSRRSFRNQARWGIATDLAVNCIIASINVRLPGKTLFPGESPFQNVKTMESAEYYYQFVKDEHCEKSYGFGDVLVDDEDEDAWKSAISNAAKAHGKRAGKLPGGLAHIVDEIDNPKVNYKDALREFLSSYSRNDYSWMRPNRRYVHQGLYLPGMMSEDIGEIAIAIDTSGSIYTPTIMKAISSEVQGALDAYSCTAKIIYCDCQIQHVTDWCSTSGPLQFEFKGGGGTSHRPVWEWIATNMSTPPRCAICISDGYTDFGEDPGYPVLWILTEDVNTPFGKAVKIDVN
jgi:predicted metal-dependent peptidase